jgi:hypothetical protein
LGNVIVTVWDGVVTLAEKMSVRQAVAFPTIVAASVYVLLPSSVADAVPLPNKDETQTMILLPTVVLDGKVYEAFKFPPEPD